MANSEQTDRTSDPAPDLFAHLERVFGWSETQAIDALGAYVMSTEAGRALRGELDSTRPIRSKLYRAELAGNAAPA